MMINKFICKDTYDIDGMIVGRIGDVITIIDAIPHDGESYKDVEGYCDIINETTGKVFGATWIDVDDTILEIF